MTIQPAQDTGARILDTAERLAQTRGFNGFSYADVAGELELTTAALHYHFPAKADLGVALVERYATRFRAALETLDGLGARAALEGFAELYASVLRGDRMCLCGMLAAEFETLPEGMREAVLGFFELCEDWLERVLERGRADGALVFAGDAREEARLLLGTLEGAMLIARPTGDVARFDAIVARLVATLET
ncbi:MAG: TetR/AcrR family transcriptional regulator [Gaiella sp.]